MKNLKSKFTASALAFLVMAGSCLPTVFADPPRCRKKTTESSTKVQSKKPRYAPPRRCKKTTAVPPKDLDETQSETIEVSEMPEQSRNVIRKFPLAPVESEVSETIEDPVKLISPLDNSTKLPNENPVNLPSLSSTSGCSLHCSKALPTISPFQKRSVIPVIDTDGSSFVGAPAPGAVLPGKLYNGHPAEFYLDRLSWKPAEKLEIYSIENSGDLKVFLKQFEDSLIKRCLYEKCNIDILLHRFAGIKSIIESLKEDIIADPNFWGEITQSVENLDYLNFRSKVVGDTVKRYVEGQYLSNRIFLNQTRAVYSTLQDYATAFCEGIPDFILRIINNVRYGGIVREDELTEDELLNLADRLIRIFFRTMIYRLYTGEIQ